MHDEDRLRRFRLGTARRLRENTTSAEQRLWRELDRVPLLRTHFRRQAPIGPYVVDFVCLRERLVIEVDGPSHTEPEASQRDNERTLWLEREGYRVLRFWNQEVYENVGGVLDTIYAALYGSLTVEPGAPPPPASEEL
ncbi:endonuclease domain-containing protein [Methylosinus sp. H3A]|uniref:endonuclease domain-containing protein n=1 Tax=Methylosinus sp. H3A TaxID=2785786 RepID=UPI0018C24836|nr:endonuclease domain-containing protein [Methylosinus sp. H3A]MBG0812113.1 endonuclease domain-containing protein [Methylosinus sp. H3A]